MRTAHGAARRSVPCCAVPCGAVPCCAVPCSIVQCRAERNGAERSEQPKARERMSMPRAAAANGLAKILNGSKDPVLVRPRSCVQFLSQSLQPRRGAGDRKWKQTVVARPSPHRAAPRQAATVRTCTTGDIRKLGREKKRETVHHRGSVGTGVSQFQIENQNRQIY